MNKRNKYPTAFHYWKTQSADKNIEGLSEFQYNLFLVLVSLYFDLGIGRNFSIQFLAKVLTGNKNAHLMEKAKKENTLSIENLMDAIIKIGRVKLQCEDAFYPLLPIKIEDSSLSFYEIPKFLCESKGLLQTIPIDTLAITATCHQNVNIINFKFFILHRIMCGEETIVLTMKELHKKSGMTESLKKAHDDYKTHKISYSIYLKRKTKTEKLFHKNIKSIFENLKSQKIIAKYKIQINYVILSKPKI